MKNNQRVIISIVINIYQNREVQHTNLRKSQAKEPSQTRERRRLAVRLLHTRTHRAQGEGGSGRGRGTDTPRAKSVTNTIYKDKRELKKFMVKNTTCTKI